VLVCFDCQEPILGAPGESLGTGEAEDNTLDRLLFIAQDHAALYCPGARA